MTKITETGAAARLAKLTEEIEADLNQAMDRMRPEELAQLVEQEWRETPVSEQQKLLWIAQKIQKKTLALIHEDRKEEFAEASEGRLMVAGTDEIVRKLYTKPFYQLAAPGLDLFLAISRKPPQDVVLVRSGTSASLPSPKWTHLIVGKRRYGLEATRHANIWRCKRLSHAAFQDALRSDPNLKVSVV
jgi:hypothetical protein